MRAADRRHLRRVDHRGDAARRVLRRGSRRPRPWPTVDAERRSDRRSDRARPADPARTGARGSPADRLGRAHRPRLEGSVERPSRLARRGAAAHRYGTAGADRRPVPLAVRHRLDPDPFWAVAVDLDRGDRIAFGAAGAPPTDVPSAVAASCAIPAFFEPMSIGGRRFVDGGVHSTTNGDLAKRLPDGDRPTLVLISAPMSVARGSRVGVDGAFRRAVALQVAREAAGLPRPRDLGRRLSTRERGARADARRLARSGEDAGRL